MGIVPKLPFMSLGPFGLGSQVSRWLIPPHANKMMHDLALPLLAGLFFSPRALSLRKSVKDKPAHPRLVDKTFRLEISFGSFIWSIPIARLKA